MSCRMAYVEPGAILFITERRTKVVKIKHSGTQLGVSCVQFKILLIVLMMFLPSKKVGMVCVHASVRSFTS